MRELNPIGREENQLLLVSSDGERFSVEVDETLLKTIKEHRVPDSSGVQLTPRQIQDAIRAGASVSELAESSGTSLSLIERFARPVIEELQHIVELAKSIRIEMPADRFNDVVKKEFGDLVEEKLSAAGSKELAWSAKRTEFGTWEIHISFTSGGEPGSAVWSFEPRKYLLSPETTTASNLSNPTHTFDSPLASSSGRKAVSVEPISPDTVVTEDKLQAFRTRRERIEAVKPAVEEVIEELQPTNELEITVTAPIEFIPEDVGEESQEIELPVEPEPEPVSEPEPATESASSAKKSRAPMPSWDQIVRGTQSEDDEAF